MHARNKSINKGIALFDGKYIIFIYQKTKLRNNLKKSNLFNYFSKI